MRSYLDSPLYQQMLAQATQGGPQSQYPGQAIANGLAQALQMYALKQYGDKQEAKQQAGNADLAKALLPEQFSGAGYGAPDTKTLSGGLQIDAAAPQLADQNGDKRAQLAALLNSGAVTGDSLAPMALQRLGLGEPKAPIKLGKDEGLYDPTTFQPIVRAKSAPVSLSRDSRLVNPEDGSQVVGIAPPDKDPNKPFDPLTGDPNTAYQQYETNKAHAGANNTNLNVNTDRSFGSALGGGAATILDQSATAARSGVDTINTINQIRGAIATGKVTAGPGTTAIQFFNQIAGNDPQKLAATRETIQGLSKLTLAARGQMKGQGQISDYEGRLLQKATSGDIDSMTVPEIEAILKVGERASRAAIQNNKQNVERARAVPGSGNVVDFYDVQEPAAFSPQTGIAAPGQPHVLRYNPQTGRLE